MDFEQITDKEKEALHIACVSESDVTIRHLHTTLDLTRYADGEIEVEITDSGDHTSMTFNKEQIKLIADWFNHSR